MSNKPHPEANFPLVSTLHAEGRHIDAEWERVKLAGARDDVPEADLASYRLVFFLGALSVWQAIQDATDEAVVNELQAELEAFVADMEAESNMPLASRPAGGERRPRRVIH